DLHSYPTRRSSDLMGDVLTLIEKAQAAVDEERAKELERKMRTQQFTFDDFLEQLQQVRNMGPLDEILGMIPGLSQAKELKNLQEIGRASCRERVKDSEVDGAVEEKKEGRS